MSVVKMPMHYLDVEACFDTCLAYGEMRTWNEFLVDYAPMIDPTTFDRKFTAEEVSNAYERVISYGADADYDEFCARYKNWMLFDEFVKLQCEV